jgi:hypothetical protein
MPLLTEHQKEFILKKHAGLQEFMDKVKADRSSK